MKKEKKVPAIRYSRFDMILELFNFALYNPVEFDIKIDKGGFSSVLTLLDKCQKKGYTVGREDLSGIVKTNKESKILIFVNGIHSIKTIKPSVANNIDFFKEIKVKNV
jgi:hypothetical protein